MARRFKLRKSNLRNDLFFIAIVWRRALPAVGPWLETAGNARL
jgi:hypothetical protein